MTEEKKTKERKSSKKESKAASEAQYEHEYDDEHLFEDWDEFVADPEEVSRLSKAFEQFVPGVLKRGISSGIGNLMSEDGLRALVAEKKLPKEVVSYLLHQADATKREFLRIISREIRLFLQNMDFGGELTKILTSVSFEVKTEVRFIPNDAAFRPDVRNRVKVKKKRSDQEHEESDDDVADEEWDDEELDGVEDDESTTTRRKKSRRWSRRTEQEDTEEDSSDTVEHDEEE